MKKIMLLLCLSFLAIVRVQAMSSIDVDKIRYVAGEGARLYAIVICHGDNERLDNFVFGYRTDDAVLSYADVLDTFVKADSRFDVRTNGDKILSVSFDLDGNGIFDERDVIAPGEWSVSADMLASDSSTPVVALCNGVNVLDVPYYFYLPEPDEVGVWVPEAMTVSLSDESFVLPVLVQPQGNTVANTTNWQASSSNETYRLDRTKIVTPYTFIDGSYHARPSMVGATGVTYVRYRPMIGGTYVESNYLTLTIKEPEVPMTSIIFTEEEIHSPLNRVVEYGYAYEPDNATYTAIKLVSSDTKIATWSASAGLKTTTVAGTATITASCNYNSSVTASFNLVSSLRNPVTGVNFGPGTEDGVINVPVKQLIGLRPIIEPADADIPSVTIKLSDNGSSRGDYTCTTYNVNYWDANNVRSQFLELSGHRPTGDRPAKLTVTSADGNYLKDFVVNVVESDRTPLPGGYEDGTIILNEEWFGHTNGGLNYITEDGEIIYQAYERENPGMSFGCTSQYGTIWAGKLFVMSKQAADGGDVLPGGGRLVIADAKTLKRIGSLDVLSYDGKSGDGRAIAGATPDKVYAGTSNGIYIVDIKDPAAPVVVGRIGLSDNNDLYSGQIGDMITAGRHVFAVMQANGLIIIDVDTDETSVISDSNVQGVTQTADGKVWYCTTGKDDAGANCSVFVALDPETLEEVDRVKMPASIGTVACGWGAWRSTAFKGAIDGNDIWFVTGAAGIMGGATGDYYRYTVGEDPEGIEPFFSLTGVMGETGFGEEVGQMTYGTPCFDARNNHLVVMAGRKNAASGGYRDHWIHFVDGDSHEITKTFKLNPYYWFQSLPIFPDKYAPEIEADDFVFIVGDEAEKRELSVTDEDNIDNNIILTVEPSEYSTVAEVFLDGRMLSVTPLSVGKAYFTLMAQSNGKIASKTVAVEVKDKPVGIDDVNTVEGSVSCNGKDVVFRDFSGENFALYDMAGHFITDITVDTDVFVARLGHPAGVYVLRSANGVTAKIVLN